MSLVFIAQTAVNEVHRSDCKLRHEPDNYRGVLKNGGHQKKGPMCDPERPKSVGRGLKGNTDFQKPGLNVEAH